MFVWHTLVPFAEDDLFLDPFAAAQDFNFDLISGGVLAIRLVSSSIVFTGWSL